jgi:signal recognition particle receptor subunit beta
VVAPDAVSVKVVVSGGFGVGKTTLVAAISEIDPLVTEAAMTEVAVGVDTVAVEPGAAGSEKSTTTVALDFGRITLDPSLVLYLFGTPGQDRFAFLWDDLVDGALGAVVLADTRRIQDCYPAVDYFEERGTPFLLAVNHFAGSRRFDLDEVREALGLSGSIPVIECDARSRESVKAVLAALMDQVILRHSGAFAGAVV